VILFPGGFELQVLRSDHARAPFDSGQAQVNQWLHGQALQSQTKHLSATRVLVDANDQVAGFFTLATGQVHFGDLPSEIVKRLPRRALPVAVLAWLGVAKTAQGRGLGSRLLAQALLDCHAAGRTFPFVAVVLDSVDERSKAFYERWDFREIGGRPSRLFLSAAALDALVATRE
jgi:GNAT superfamily N-acetyltransferase